MSAVVDAISDIVDVVVAITAIAISSVLVVFTAGLITLSQDFNDFVLDQMAVVMSLFGIDDQDIIETFVSDQRLMPDADVSNFMAKLALEHEYTQRNIIDIFATQTSHIRGSFNGYYDNGINDYTPGLPQATIHAEYVPSNLNTFVDLEKRGGR